MSEEGNKAYALFSKLSSVIEKFSHDGNGIFEQMAADDEYMKTDSLDVKRSSTKNLDESIVKKS